MDTSSNVRGETGQEIDASSEPTREEGLVLELIDVYRYYNMGMNDRVHALDGVSLKVYKGDFLSVMGPSGSGKTTLLNQIAALDTPTSGKVILNNQNLQDLGDKQLTEIRRHQIGLVFQYNNLLPVLTALENVALPLT